jgi:hypothetical protein
MVICFLTNPRQENQQNEKKKPRGEPGIGIFGHSRKHIMSSVGRLVTVGYFSPLSSKRFSFRAKRERTCRDVSHEILNSSDIVF